MDDVAIVHIKVNLMSRGSTDNGLAFLTIGDVAQRTQKRASSIRYYEAIGLLPEPLRVNGRRRYQPGRSERSP